MIKKQFYNYWKNFRAIQDLVTNRSISCSASQNQDLTVDVSKRLFPEKLRKESYTNDIDVRRIAVLLDGRNNKFKNSLRKFLSSSIMKPRYNISLEEERNLSHRRLKHICDAGFMSASTVIKDPQSMFNTHELAAVVDPAMAFKMNVQFNLFAGTLFKLGTDSNYNKILPHIDSLNAVGCFGLAELGYGNNILELETTAIYDHDTKEIILNTPNPLAQKYWVTNAVHAKLMIVFAQLIVNRVNVGIHGILVRIRDENLKIMPDVHIEDMGHKMGLNGVDTAKVSFDNVRVPLENLLNRYYSITSDGEYVSESKKDQITINSEKHRFMVMSDDLLTGRISTAAMCSGAAKASLAIAIKYSATRLAMGPEGKQDVTILQYQLQQRALIPLLARTYALQFGLNYVQSRYCHQASDGSHHFDVVSLASAIKALLSWNLENVVKVCRERCGGQGFLSCNRFGSFLGLAHAAISTEGDNSVLMQKVVRQRLTVFRQRPVTEIPRDFAILAFLVELLNKKENLLFLELKRKVYDSGKEKAFDLWVLEESDLVQACGVAFIERAISDDLIMVIKNCERKECNLVGALHRLYILNIIERDLGLFMKHGIVGVEEITEIEYQSSQLCRHLGGVALELIEVFGFSEEILSAPIASDWVQYNAADNKGEV